MLSLTDTPAERRLHPRNPTQPLFLLMAGRPARLLDWSFGGMRIQLETDDHGFALGQSVDVTVLRPDGRTWARLPVVIRHVDRSGPCTLGVMLADRIAAFPIVLDLFNHSLA